jgi:hypothetical protein
MKAFDGNLNFRAADLEQRQGGFLTVRSGELPDELSHDNDAHIIAAELSSRPTKTGDLACSLWTDRAPEITIPLMLFQGRTFAADQYDIKVDRLLGLMLGHGHRHLGLDRECCADPKARLHERMQHGAPALRARMVIGEGQYTIVCENAVTLGPNRAEALGEGRNIGVLDLGW